MTIEEAILYRYKIQAKTNEPDTDLLFDVISKYIKEMDWIYDGSASEKETYKLQEQKKLEVNCFILTDLFIHISKQIGTSPDECFQVVIPNFVSTLNNPRIQGDYKPFTSTCPADSDGRYEFDVHCIAMINSSCFDLVLQAKYLLVNDGADIFSSLSVAMGQNNIDDFKFLLPYLLDKNEQCSLSSWTLLHEALSNGKFDFAMELLRNGAQDNILDDYQNTPLDILNNQLYDPYVSLETLSKAREYQDLKIELIIKNRTEQLEIERKAARTIQSFWRKRQNHSNPSVAGVLAANQPL